jgi:hypothetical protein
MRTLLRNIALAGCLASAFGVNAGGSAAAATVTAAAGASAAQCRGTDRTIPKRIRFQRGRTTAVIKDTVRLCTSHEYRLRALAGQRMAVHLAAGRRTSFTVHTPAGDTPEGADGSNDWNGELPETGEYTINVATDATAAYTLEVTIR